MPEFDVLGLITDGRLIDKGYFVSNSIRSYLCYEHDVPDYPELTEDNVTHWQPLLTPPNAGGE